MGGSSQEAVPGVMSEVVRVWLLQVKWKKKGQNQSHGKEISHKTWSRNDIGINKRDQSAPSLQHGEKGRVATALLPEIRKRVRTWEREQTHLKFELECQVGLDTREYAPSGDEKRPSWS